MAPEPDKPLYFKRALRKRCPQCGEGQLFRGFARLNETCSHCALRFRRESGSQTGAMYFCAAVTEIFAALIAVAMFLLTDWSLPVGLTIGTVLVLTFSYVFLPVSMAFWTAVEYSTDVSNGESWVKPRG